MLPVEVGLRTYNTLFAYFRQIEQKVCFVITTFDIFQVLKCEKKETGWEEAERQNFNMLKNIWHTISTLVSTFHVEICEDVDFPFVRDLFSKGRSRYYLEKKGISSWLKLNNSIIKKLFWREIKYQHMSQEIFDHK